MVKVFTGVREIVRAAAESSAAEKSGGLGEPFEQRFQFGQASMFGVGEGGFQPVFDGHHDVLGL
jgi:hypothetical protein